MNQTTPHGQHCPYLVVAAFPDRIPQVIGRTYNQIDAQTHIRFLKRRLQHGNFFLVYDPEVSDAGVVSKLVVPEREVGSKQQASKSTSPGYL